MGLSGYRGLVHYDRLATMTQQLHVFVVQARPNLDLAREIEPKVPNGHRIVALATMPAADNEWKPGVCVTMVTEPGNG
jgi:hypothetical protein